MTRLDVTARAQAQRMIDTYGKAITFTRIARGSYDPNTSTVTPAQTTQSVKAYLSSPSAQQLEKGVLATSMVALVAAKALTIGDPVAGDRFTIDGKGYTVGWRDPLWSGEQVAMWTLELKK
jgi:hypothetical protein